MKVGEDAICGGFLLVMFSNLIIFIVIHFLGSNSKLFRILKTQIFDKPVDTLKVAVPAIVYYIQNNLIYFGATHLDAATAQVK